MGKLPKDTSSVVHFYDIVDRKRVKVSRKSVSLRKTKNGRCQMVANVSGHKVYKFVKSGSKCGSKTSCNKKKAKSCKKSKTCSWVSGKGVRKSYCRKK